MAISPSHGDVKPKANGSPATFRDTASINDDVSSIKERQKTPGVVGSSNAAPVSSSRKDNTLEATEVIKTKDQGSLQTDSEEKKPPVLDGYVLFHEGVPVMVWESKE